MTLQSLISAVERGEWPGEINGIARAVFPYHEDWRKDHGMTAREAFDGSLDAAKRLHDALLPGCSATIDTDGVADIFTGEAGRFDGSLRRIGGGDIDRDPARAWLLAILRALEGEP